MTELFGKPLGNETAFGWLPEDDWTVLVGRWVEIHDRGRLADRGLVDCVTSDGTILWLHQDGATPRRIIERGPDISIRPCSISVRSRLSEEPIRRVESPAQG